MGLDPPECSSRFPGAVFSSPRPFGERVPEGRVRGPGFGERAAGNSPAPGRRPFGCPEARAEQPQSKVDGSLAHDQAACTDRRRRHTQRIRSGATAAADTRKTQVEGSGVGTKSRVIGVGLFWKG